MYDNYDDDDRDDPFDNNRPADYDIFDATSVREEEIPAVRKWKLGKYHATKRVDFDADELAAQADALEGLDDDLAGLFREAAKRAPRANIKDYECPVCGLTHGHGPDKHDIRDPGREGFHVRADFAEMMKYNAACHCGVNELAMLIDFADEIQVPIFTDGADLSAGDRNQRFENIRAAANMAKIAKPTRNRIEQARNQLEARFADDDTDDDSGPSALR